MPNANAFATRWLWFAVTSLVGMLVTNAARGADIVTYYHTDTLGTPVLESNAAGTVTYVREHKPYGQQALGTKKDGPGFTGHVEDADTGLTYMQSRYYDSEAGRFISVDPVSSGTTGDNYSRYWYANNNPLGFLDPSGMLAMTAHDDDEVVPSDGQTTPESRTPECDDACQLLKWLAEQQKKNADIVLTPSQVQAVINAAKAFPDPYAEETESYLKVDVNGTATKPTSEGCGPASCNIPLTSNDRVAVHLHPGNSDEAKAWRNEFPSGADYKSILQGVIPVVLTPSGALRAIEYRSGKLEVRTIYGGNPNINGLIRRKWTPGLGDSTRTQLTNKYRANNPP